jgi:hypothetical protein
MPEDEDVFTQSGPMRLASFLFPGFGDHTLVELMQGSQVKIYEQSEENSLERPNMPLNNEVVGC